VSGAPPFAKLVRRARWARIALLGAAGILTLELAWSLLGAFLMGGFVEAGDWSAWWDRGVVLSNVLHGSALVVAGFFVLRCQRELLRGLRDAGVRTLSPDVTLATVSWFIPFVNFFLPLKSFRQVGAAVGPGRAASVTRALDSWWALWLCGAIATRVAAVINKTADTPGTWLWGAAFGTVGAALLLWAGLLLAAILPRLAEQQAELRMLLDAIPNRPDSFLTADDLGTWWHRTVERSAPPMSAPPAPTP
jgi:hypothetical protein